jgi:hypothetical protein
MDRRQGWGQEERRAWDAVGSAQGERSNALPAVAAASADLAQGPGIMALALMRVR